MSDDEESELRRRLEVVEDQWRRAAADLDNLQKRFARELASGQLAERKHILLTVVSLLDDLERALQGVSDDSDFVAGVRSILRNGTSAVESFGFPRFGQRGDRFDPLLHEVIATVPAGTESSGGAEPAADTIIAVTGVGYGTPEALLRPAAVVVASGAE